MFINLKGKQFEEKKDKYYNLKTGRYVKKQPKTLPDPIGLKNINVIGTLEMVKKFWDINRNELRRIYPNGINIRSVLENPFTNPDNGIEMARHVCMNLSKKECINVNINDIEDIPEEHLKKLDYFDIANVFVKARVTKVIDGDTIDIACILPSNYIYNTNSTGKVNAYRCGNPAYKYQSPRIISKFKLRLVGIDSAEKDTNAGKIAKQVMADKIESLNGIVWVLLISHIKEKYGRVLSIVYEDKEMKKCVNTVTTEFSKKSGVEIARSYHGGAKHEFPIKGEKKVVKQPKRPVIVKPKRTIKVVRPNNKRPVMVKPKKGFMKWFK